MEISPRVAILGATGFIGKGLSVLLQAQGMACTGVSRSSAPAAVFGIDRWQTLENMDFSGHLAVINLAGAPIVCRWNAKNRQDIWDSRVGVTRRVVETLRTLSPEFRPKVLINASAMGFYGNRGDKFLTENSPCGEGFLAELCEEWEHAALEASALGMRVALLRSGIVLGEDGGVFPKLAMIFRACLGGKLGSGKQWMPWIHIADHRAAILHILSSQSLSGPVNLCASAERNGDFTQKIAKTLHRPAILDVPAFVLKLVLNGLGRALLSSQRAEPAKLAASGFLFRFPSLELAVEDLAKKLA